MQVIVNYSVQELNFYIMFLPKHIFWQPKNFFLKHTKYTILRYCICWIIIYYIAIMYLCMYCMVCMVLRSIVRLPTRINFIGYQSEYHIIKSLHCFIYFVLFGNWGIVINDSHWLILVYLLRSIFPKLNYMIKNQLLKQCYLVYI